VGAGSRFDGHTGAVPLTTDIAGEILLSTYGDRAGQTLRLGATLRAAEAMIL
jgi:hypothetical protein